MTFVKKKKTEFGEADRYHDFLVINLLSVPNTKLTMREAFVFRVWIEVCWNPVQSCLNDVIFFLRWNQTQRYFTGMWTLNVKTTQSKYDRVFRQWTLHIAWSGSASSWCSVSSGQDALLEIHFHLTSRVWRNARVIIVVNVSLVCLFWLYTFLEVLKLSIFSWPVSIFSTNSEMGYSDPMELLR